MKLLRYSHKAYYIFWLLLLTRNKQNWVHDKHFGTHELLRRIITYKLAGIDPRDLAALAVKMKHPRSGVKQAISPVRLTSVFVGLDAIKWLMSTWNLSEEESTEVFIQLLKEGFVTSAKSSDPANRFVYKKTRKYSFNVSPYSFLSSLHALILLTFV